MTKCFQELDCGMELDNLSKQMGGHGGHEAPTVYRYKSHSNVLYSGAYIPETL